MSYAAHVTPPSVAKTTKRDLKRKIEELEKELEATRSANEALRARVEKVEGERDSAVTAWNRTTGRLSLEEQKNGELREENARLKNANELLITDNEALHPELFRGD